MYIHSLFSSDIPPSSFYVRIDPPELIINRAVQLDLLLSPASRFDWFRPAAVENGPWSTIPFQWYQPIMSFW